MHVGAGIIKLL